MEILNLEYLNFGILLGAICSGIPNLIGIGINYILRLIRF